jgi:hypothetical protein
VLRQTDRIDDRLDAGDASARETVDGVSINELHAALLGGELGVLSGRTDSPRAALLVAAISLAWPAGGPVGLRTLRREPWWSLAGLAVGFVIGQRTAPADE